MPEILYSKFDFQLQYLLLSIILKILQQDLWAHTHPVITIQSFSWLKKT